MSKETYYIVILKDKDCKPEEHFIGGCFTTREQAEKACKRIIKTITARGWISVGIFECPLDRVIIPLWMLETPEDEEDEEEDS